MQLAVLPRFFNPPTQEDIDAAHSLVRAPEIAGQGELAQSLARVVHAVDRVRDSVGLVPTCMKEQR